jgi:putative oxidoreductase
MDVGLLIVRVVVGLLFAVHGTQKLFGWFGGYGLQGTAGFMGQLRYRQPQLAALTAGTFETGAGLFLAAGFLTPLAAAALIGVMINAIVSAKLKAGLIGGYELDVLYASAAAGLAFTGAGRYSVDNVLRDAFGWTLAGTTWGVIALAFGVVIAGLVLASRTPARAVVEQTAEAAEGQRAA